MGNIARQRVVSIKLDGVEPNKEEAMIVQSEQYWASRDGIRHRVDFAPDVKEGVIKAYRDAGYVISIVTDSWDTGWEGGQHEPQE